jgi:hypothetical protein
MRLCGDGPDGTQPKKRAEPTAENHPLLTQRVEKLVTPSTVAEAGRTRLRLSRVCNSNDA